MRWAVSFGGGGGVTKPDFLLVHLAGELQIKLFLPIASFASHLAVSRTLLHFSHSTQFLCAMVLKNLPALATPRGRPCLRRGSRMGNCPPVVLQAVLQGQGAAGGSGAGAGAGATPPKSAQLSAAAALALVRPVQQLSAYYYYY